MSDPSSNPLPPRPAAQGAVPGDPLAHRVDRPTGAVDPRLVEERMRSIRADLAHGDIDRAYGTFSDWIRQEVRYATAERPTNLPELMSTMLGMMDWMYARVSHPVQRTSPTAAG